MSRIQILRAFFETEPHGRRVTMEEIKALSAEEREELATLAAAELGEPAALAA